MSDETVVETDGVTVSKFFNAEDFPVPAVAFDVDSSRDDAVTLRIVDEIPDEFGIDQIGFHPEYGSEHWTASGDGVVRFEREIEPGESFTTVYGVRMEEGQDETPFLSAPTVELDGEDIDDVVPPESTDVVRELAGGDRDTVPGLEDDAEEAGLEADIEGSIESLEEEDAEILEGDVDLGDEPSDDEELDTEDEAFEAEPEPSTEPESEGFGGEQPEPDADDEEPLAEPEAEGFGEEEADTEEPAELEPEPAPSSVGFDAGDLVATLAEAIRNDEVSDDDLETLQDAFGGVPNSTQVEIEHLQSRVSELEAYTDALEEFLDEEGTAQQLVSDVEDEVASLSAALDDLDDELGEVEASVEDAAGDREQLRERVADVEAEVDAVDDLHEDVERLRGDVDAIDERLEDTEDAVMEVDELEDDLDDVSEDLEDLEDHVDEIEEWRSQLSDVFGA
ncbi:MULTISPECIES: hypothetical protein [Halobacterium]|uniref:hypothetical protein n=1 Tax=Halobacterium TaxID=2239 RepID=UPI00073EA3DB|nr:MULTISPECIES: hypothetical protein [Halobacterium]MCG1002828.1 hypothetical protein [Halobacterium noricense]